MIEFLFGVLVGLALGCYAALAAHWAAGRMLEELRTAAGRR